MMDHFALEYQEFAAPNTCEKLACQGRPCAKCHKCVDWHFVGDQATWNWITNWSNWTDKEWKRFDNDGVYRRFTKRDGATCRVDRPIPYDPITRRVRDLPPRAHLCVCELH